jgi:hypothetical protein
MPRRPHRHEAHASAFDGLSIPQRVRSVNRTEREDRRAGHGGERSGAGRVVRMAVRHEDGADAARLARDLLEMTRLRRAGIDDEGRIVSDDPCVGPLQRMDARVRREHANGAHRTHQPSA